MTTVDSLIQRANLATFRINQSKINQDKRTEQDTIINNSRIAYDRLTQALAVYAGVVEGITAYLDTKRKDGDMAVLNAMRMAATIVPSSDTTIVPRCDDGEAWFETADGIDVSHLEGGGYRSILSVFMRAVTCQSNPQVMHTLILDELFAKLSVENSATLSSYLPIMAQNLQIISIEQKPEVFADTPHVAYHLRLEGDHTVTEREDVNLG